MEAQLGLFAPADHDREPICLAAPARQAGVVHRHQSWPISSVVQPARRFVGPRVIAPPPVRPLDPQHTMPTACDFPWAPGPAPIAMLVDRLVSPLALSASIDAAVQEPASTLRQGRLLQRTAQIGVQVVSFPAYSKTSPVMDHARQQQDSPAPL